MPAYEREVEGARKVAQHAKVLSDRLQQQLKGSLFTTKGTNGSFQPVGQMFSYPFSRSWNETEDGQHYPKLSDLQCAPPSPRRTRAALAPHPRRTRIGLAQLLDRL